MNILILYGATEGRRHNVATLVADQLSHLGHGVASLDAQRQPAKFDLSSFDVVVIAARVHMGSYQRSIRNFITRYLEQPHTMPCILISVSMAAGNHRSGDLDHARNCAEQFQHKTGWRPGTSITLLVCACLRSTIGLNA